MWRMIPKDHRGGGRRDPGIPLILAGWWSTSDEEKRDRFREQLRYAEDRGVLTEVIAFLQELTEDDWLRG